MPRPATFRPVRHRTFGSGTRLVDEIPMPGPVYHGGRGVRWMWQHRRRSGVALAVVFLWWLTGSLVAALLLLGVLTVAVAVGLTTWLLWRRGPEGASFSPREAREVLAGILAERRQRASLEHQWSLACETAGLIGKRHGAPPPLRKVKAKTTGTLEAVVYAGKIGVPVPRIAKETVTLAEVIGCREVVVKQIAPGVAHLAFHWTDPVGRVLPLADLPVAPKGHLSYGIRQDGGVATVRLNQSILIGGLTRMGKSNTVWALLADTIRQGIPVDLYVSDPKGGVELDAFEEMVGAEADSLIRVRQYAKTPKETLSMIEAVEKAMHARQFWMKQNGARQISPDRVNPLVVTILDETLPLTDLLKKGTDSPLGRVAYTGAAAGYVVWANTQVAQVDALGRFRDLIPQRICFATPNPQVTDSVLGQGSESMGARCSEIRTAGVGFSYSEGQHTARKFRAAFVTDAETRLIAKGRLPRAVTDKTEQMYARQSDPGATAVYTYRDAQGRPVYIGKSNDPVRRDAEHRRARAPWLEAVQQWDVAWFPTQVKALEVEAAEIKKWQPIGNIMHNEAHPRRRLLVTRVDLRRVKSKVAA